MDTRIMALQNRILNRIIGRMGQQPTDTILDEIFWWSVLPWKRNMKLIQMLSDSDLTADRLSLIQGLQSALQLKHLSQRQAVHTIIAGYIVPLVLCIPFMLVLCIQVGHGMNHLNKLLIVFLYAEATLVFAHLLYVVLTPITLPLGFWLARKRKVHLCILLVDVLGRMKAVEALETMASMAELYRKMITAVRKQNRTLQTAIREALEQTLPRLTEADYGTVSADTTIQLISFVDDRHAEFTCIVLAALRKVGGGAVLPKVQALARVSPDPAVRSMAEELVPILQARQEQERSSSQLLRASTNTGSSDQLLRPAGAEVPAIDPLTLLRASCNQAVEEIQNVANLGSNTTQ